MKMPLLSKVIAAVAASAILQARASTFTVGGSGNTFTVSRSGAGVAAFLLNVAPWATPIELRIAGIEVVEGGARVRVAATAGGAKASLQSINGVMSLLAGDDLDALAPKAASGITYSEGEATIFVPASAGRFVKSVIGLTVPAEGE